MVERLRPEVRVELSVDHPEHIAVELGGDALRVVVGGLQHRGVLDEVGSEQQAVIRAEEAKRHRVVDVSAEQCGWLKDRYGLSWQIVPKVLGELMASTDRAKAKRASDAMLKMVKLDIAALRAAFDGTKAAPTA